MAATNNNDQNNIVPLQGNALLQDTETVAYKNVQGQAVMMMNPEIKSGMQETNPVVVSENVPLSNVQGQDHHE